MKTYSVPMQTITAPRKRCISAPEFDTYFDISESISNWKKSIIVKTPIKN